MDFAAHLVTNLVANLDPAVLEQMIDQEARAMVAVDASTAGFLGSMAGLWIEPQLSLARHPGIHRCMGAIVAGCLQFSGGHIVQARYFSVVTGMSWTEDPWQRRSTPRPTRLPRLENSRMASIPELLSKSFQNNPD